MRRLTQVQKMIVSVHEMSVRSQSPFKDWRTQSRAESAKLWTKQAYQSSQYHKIGGNKGSRGDDSRYDSEVYA
jgi:hypothetical protein